MMSDGAAHRRRYHAVRSRLPRVVSMLRWPVWRRSLPARLALWYSALLTVVLMLFGFAVYMLTAGAVFDGVRGTVNAEARVATNDLGRALGSTAPYWPDHLALEAVDSYTEPGVTIEVRDLQGHLRYRSATGHKHPIPLPDNRRMAVLAGNTVWYTTSIEGDRARVEALPILAPTGVGTQPPIIGTLLIAKSLRDVQTTLTILRTLLLVGGAVALGMALAGGWTIAAQILHPLSEVADAAGTIAASATGTRIGGLSQRVRRPKGEDELANLVDTFNTMLTALERATRTQQRFVADASHELRAPLTTVQGNLALLLEHEKEITPDERREMLVDAQAETLRLVKLVNDLLALARADAPGDSLPGIPIPASAELTGKSKRPPLVDLDRIVLDLVRQMRARLAADASPLRLEIARVEPVHIRGDAEELRQLVLILVDNAIKYTPTDRPEARVTVSLELRDDQALLRVRDTGIGIDAADLPHIFDRFYRADPARDRHGTGLGLAIARALAQQHGGSISVESAPDRGSTFTVRLPAPPIA